MRNVKQLVIKLLNISLSYLKEKDLSVVKNIIIPAVFSYERAVAYYEGDEVWAIKCKNVEM